MEPQVAVLTERFCFNSSDFNNVLDRSAIRAPGKHAFSKADHLYLIKMRSKSRF